MTNVQMQIGLEVIRSYRRLDYTPWYALAEFVDNSTQSFRDNRTALNKAYKRDSTHLAVSISYDRNAAVLIVRDNAMGMSLTELRRALQIGKPPIKTSGRSQFGLGLKTAACWFGDKWSVRTKKLGQTHGHMITVDVEKVADGQKKLDYERFKAEKTDHFTEIRIEELHVVLQGRRLGKTKDSLSSMFRVDIRNKELTLTWDTSPLPWADTLTFLEKDDGSSEREKIDFHVGARHVEGWVDILAPGSSGRPRAGFALIRRGRLIRGWPDAWRPEAIFGPAPGRNDLINQRVVGELNLDEFDVTHTKDDINWQDTEEDEVQEGIKARIGDLLARAQSFRIKAAAKKRQSSKARAAVILSLFKRSDFPTRATGVGKAIKEILSELPPAFVTQSALEAVLERHNEHDNAARAKLGGGDVIAISVSALGEDSPYVVYETDQKTWSIVLNADHPLCDTDEASEELRLHLLHALADGFVMWARERGGLDSGTTSLLYFKDVVLRHLETGDPS